MARIALTEQAARDLEQLVATHSLPADTPERLLRRLEPLKRFPQLGPALEHGWEGYRYVLGPWRWMVVVYEHLQGEDTIAVTRIVDARSRQAPLR